MRSTVVAIAPNGREYNDWIWWESSPVYVTQLDNMAICHYVLAHFDGDNVDEQTTHKDLA